jgi:hypothetical protein
VRWRRSCREPGVDDDFFRLARPPAGHGQFSSARRRFGDRDCLAELGARVVGKRLAADSEDDVADEENAIGGRTFLHLGDGNLPRIGGHHLVAEHPAAQPRGAEIPVVLRAAGMASPWVKSGLAGLPFGSAAETLAGTANSTAATKDVRDLRVMD